MSMRYRRWIATEWEEKTWWDEAKMNYLAIGKHVGTKSGKVHWHVYVKMKNGVTMRSLKGKVFSNEAHIEKAMGKVQEILDYFGKDGDLTEEGEHSQQGQRTDILGYIETVRNGAIEEDMMDFMGQTWGLYPGLYSRVRNLIEPKRDWLVHNVVLWSEPGTGKTRCAKEAGCTFVEYNNEFFSGYDGEDIVCFDDFECEIPKGLFLRLLDRYDMSINVKYDRPRNWKPKTIYITSNTNPKEWYNFNGTGDKAVMRRLCEIKNCTEVNCTEVA